MIEITRDERTVTVHSTDTGTSLEIQCDELRELLTSEKLSNLLTVLGELEMMTNTGSAAADTCDNALQRLRRARQLLDQCPPTVRNTGRTGKKE